MRPTRRSSVSTTCAGRVTRTPALGGIVTRAAALSLGHVRDNQVEHAGDNVKSASGIFLALSLSLNVLALGQEKVPPAVVDLSGQTRLVIPSEMQTAIDKIAPGFEPWKLADYLPRLL